MNISWGAHEKKEIFERNRSDYFIERINELYKPSPTLLPLKKQVF